MKDNAKVTLTIGQLKKLVEEVACCYMGTDSRLLKENLENYLYDRILVNEMAFPKTVYERKVLGLGVQLVDNWCLCKWCQLYSQDNVNFVHWATELIAHLGNIQSWDIKGKVDKRKTLERLLVEYCDYGKPEKIASIIRSKFNDEHIMDENQRASVAVEFANNISKIIDVLSDSSIDVRVYVRETFGLPDK